MPHSSFLKAATGTGATATRAMISVTTCAYHLKLTGMLLDAHTNLMTIDIVRLLFSPKMVRLYPRPAAASRPHTCIMQLTQFTI